MIYEFRDYEAMPGKLGALNQRFADHTLGFFKQHGIGVLGFWNLEAGMGSHLIYITVYESMADREKKWAEFQANPDWAKVRRESESDGPMVTQIQNTIMRPTAYSPDPKVRSNVQELRIYYANPGKLPALNERFANHTVDLFRKHGLESVGYWTDDVGTNNRLIYMLDYPSLGDREKNFAAFGSDPDWQKARAESEANGPLLRNVEVKLMRLTPYSPR